MSPTAPCALAILAKAPVAGLAKTRLIPELGAAGAAALQHWFLQKAVGTGLDAGISPLALWCAPDVHRSAFLALAREYPALALYPQAAADLGERMRVALAETAPGQPTLVIGTDCPALTPADLRAAANVLRTHDAVLIPAEDGGYVLIGLRQPDVRVFAGVEWGSDQVLAQTRARFTALGWRWQELPTLWDVDRPEDFVRLTAQFPEVCAHLGEPA